MLYVGREYSAFISRVKHKLYWYTILVLYHPKKEWEYSFCHHLYDFCAYGLYKNWSKPFFLKTLHEEHEDLVKFFWSEKWLLLDFKLCHFLLGVNPEDYFAKGMYRHGWVYRKNRISDAKWSFMTKYANDNSKVMYLSDKMQFAKWFSDYYGRKCLKIPGASYEEFCSTFSRIDKIIIKPLDGKCGWGDRSSSYI